MNVIPDRFFRKNSPIVWETNKKLYGLGHKEIHVIERVEAMLDDGRIFLQ